MSEIMTYKRIMIDPLNPEPENILIEDIAHALSMLCRANGHFPVFYSVGQHCINCAREAGMRGHSRRVQLASLLHDASEAYLADVTRPVKKELTRYVEIEEPLQRLIWEKWLGSPLTAQEHDQVFAIDDAMLYREFLELMDLRLTEEEPVLKSEPRLSFTGFAETEAEFLEMFRELTE